MEARVLVVSPLDAERRELVVTKARGAFEPVFLEDVPPDRRDEAWARADVAVVSGFGKELPADLASRAPRLRMLQTLIAGVDHLPYASIPRSVTVCGNAGAFSVSVGEHSLALLLAAAKDIPHRTEEIREGVFDSTATSKALHGSTVLVLGMGGIGTFVARAAKALGMRVIGVSRKGVLVPPADEASDLAGLSELLPRTDFVVVAVPYTRATAGLVDRAFLERMKDDAILVNVARGRIVVEDDLYEHLRAHPSFRAALDVWWVYPDGEKGLPFHRPFDGLPNVVMTPHMAHAIPPQRVWAMEAALDNVLRFLRGEAPRNVVDVAEYDTISAPR